MTALVQLVKEMPGIKTLRQARYARFFRSADNLNLFHGIYNDFASAEKAAPKNKVLGYDHEEPASMYNEYFKSVNSSDFPAMFWLERLAREVKSIYDFGGHVGIKYYAYTQFMSEPSSIQWTTYDLPAVVARGRQIADERGEKSLHFSDSVKDLAKGFDMLFASGSFQYLENPVDLLLAGLSRKPKYILVNMLPTHNHESFVTLQNIGPAFCPYKIFHKTAFVRQVENYGYEILTEWGNPEKSCLIPFNEEYNIRGYTGFLFRKK